MKILCDATSNEEIDEATPEQIAASKAVEIANSNGAGIFRLHGQDVYVEDEVDR